MPSPDASAGGASGTHGQGERDEDDEEDADALKAHIAKMKAGGDASAGNGEPLARSVKCSEVRFLSRSWRPLSACFPSLPLFLSTLPPFRPFAFPFSSLSSFLFPLSSFLFPLSASVEGKIHDANSNLHKQCGKIFKNQDLVSFHAEKSGHSAFEESTEEVSRRERWRSRKNRSLMDFRVLSVFRCFRRRGIASTLIPRLVRPGFHTRPIIALLFASLPPAPACLLMSPPSGRLLSLAFALAFADGLVCRAQYVPLTAEQTKAKLEQLRHKLAEKRARQAVEDVEANRANEVRAFSSFRVPGAGILERSGWILVGCSCHPFRHLWPAVPAFTWDSVQVP